MNDQWITGTCRAFVLHWVMLALGATACAQDAPRADWDAASETVVVYNPDFPESESLARYYAAQRGIAAERLLGIKCAKEEAISREAFDQTIAPALRQAFLERSWFRFQIRDFRDPTTGKTKKLPEVAKSDVKILVLMHGMPSKIMRQRENPKQAQEDEASVDSEIAVLWQPLATLPGTVPNPFFGKEQRFPDVPSARSMLLVGRLDAASPATVRRMIDDAIAVERDGLRGRGVIDLALKKGAYDEGEEWLRVTAQHWHHAGIPAYIDRYEPVLREGWPLPDTALYFGWYTGEVSGALKSPSFRFQRGAIACHLHSFSASIIRTSTQAWVGPLLEHGAAATMGNVWEPYLSYTVHFDILNDRLLKGWTLAEAAWCATPALSWMNVVIGDPLYRPFAHRSKAEDDYATLKVFVTLHAADKDSTALKKDVLKFAQEYDNARLIELLALWSSQESKVAEAIGLLQHARSLYAKAEDKVRTVIYEVELLRRDHDPAQETSALELLQSTFADASLTTADSFPLVVTMRKELGGK